MRPDWAGASPRSAAATSSTTTCCCRAPCTATGGRTGCRRWRQVRVRGVTSELAKETQSGSDWLGLRVLQNDARLIQESGVKFRVQMHFRSPLAAASVLRRRSSGEGSTNDRNCCERTNCDVSSGSRVSLLTTNSCRSRWTSRCSFT